MKIKKLITISLALILAMCMITESAFALGITTRRAGVNQDYDGSVNSYTSSGVKVSNGLVPSRVGGYITYNLKDDIAKAFISVNGGEDGVDFKILTSKDGKDFAQLMCTRKSAGFAMAGQPQFLFEYSTLPEGQKFLKIEFLTTNIVVNGTYINIDASLTPYSGVYEIAFKDNTGASQNTTLMDDFKLLKKNMKESLYTTADVSALLSSMSNDGSWPTIKYDGKTVNYSYSHCEKFTTILRAISNPKHKDYKNEEAIKKVCRAIDFWIAKNISFDNWYYNGIVVPEYIGESLLVSADILPQSTLQKLSNYMKTKVSYIDQIALRDAGSNIVHEMKAKMYYALYLDDLKMLLDAFDRINMEIIVVDDMGEDQNFRDDMWRGYVKVSYLPGLKEGIQADYSAMFHGPLIYSGGYGQVMVSLVAPLLAMTDGTKLFPQTGLQVLADHILEHYAYVTRGNKICLSTTGRNITNAGFSYPTTIINSTKTLLKLKDMPRRDELQAFVDAAAVSGGGEYLKADFPAVAVDASAEPELTSLATSAIDGNLSTRWASNNATDYIITDLGEVKNIGVIGVAFYMGTTRKSNFELHVSTDKTNWTEICKGQGSGVIDDFEYFVFDPKDVRYIKVTGHGNTSNEWNSINEIAAFKALPEDGIGKYGENYVYVDTIGNAKRYKVVEPEPMPDPAITGHRHFWKADFTGHAKEGYLATIRAASHRTLGGEALNTQNLKGHFMGDGATFVYRTGTEYDDIFVAWDWHKIPGTTVETHPFDEITSIEHHFHSSESYRVNGVSDGNNGATAMELIHDSLFAKKGWFMFDNEFVALGADIKLGSSKYSAISTVNQTLLKSDAIIGSSNGSKTVITSETPDAQTASWAHQDRVGYIFGKDSKIHVTAKEQTGDRYDIDWGGAVPRPDKNNFVTKNIFALWFDHTADKSSTYEYIVVPNVSEEELMSYMADNPIVVVSNTGKLQAVENTLTGEKQAIFWKAGTVNFDDITIECDSEVIIAISKSGANQVLAISSLDQSEGKVNLKITRDGITEELTVELPTARYAGSSLLINLNSGEIVK